MEGQGPLLLVRGKVCLGTPVLLKADLHHLCQWFNGGEAYEGESEVACELGQWKYLYGLCQQVPKLNLEGKVRS